MIDRISLLKNVQMHGNGECNGVNHGDRSGGLLSGYVGLITVPVAYNCYAKGARSCKSGYGVF